MPGIIVNEGKLLALNDEITSLLVNCTLRLFKNNYIPVPGSLLANFTEPTGVSVGYAPFTLNSGWGAPVLGVDQFYTTTNSVRTWTNSGLVNWEAVYGWFYVDPTNTYAISAGLFNTPITLLPGQTLPMIPVFALGSEY